jgi:hypothetical protein
LVFHAYGHVRWFITPESVVGSGWLMGRGVSASGVCWRSWSLVCGYWV